MRKIRAPENRDARVIAGRFCILVNSSDQARDVFEIVFRNQEMWRDCDWPRYVGFTSQHPDRYGFQVVAAGKVAGWREQLMAQIDGLPPEIDYILRIEEDFLLLSPIDTRRLDAIAEQMVRAGLVYVSLIPLPRSFVGWMIEQARRMFSRQPLRPLSFSEPYYCSLNPAIWKRSYLRELLRRPGNVWEFEHIVTEARHYAVWEPALQYDALVAKGKWLPRARRQLERQGLSLADTGREFQAPAARLRDLRQRFVFALFGFLSLRLRKKLNMLPNVPRELKRDQFAPVHKEQSQ